MISFLPSRVIVPCAKTLDWRLHGEWHTNMVLLGINCLKVTGVILRKKVLVHMCSERLEGASPHPCLCSLVCLCLCGWVGGLVSEWDTCAAQAVVEAAGGEVLQAQGGVSSIHPHLTGYGQMGLYAWMWPLDRKKPRMGSLWCTTSLIPSTPSSSCMASVSTEVEAGTRPGSHR